jgi:hypothetical protein
MRPSALHDADGEQRDEGQRQRQDDRDVTGQQKMRQDRGQRAEAERRAHDERALQR